MDHELTADEFIARLEADCKSRYPKHRIKLIASIDPFNEYTLNDFYILLNDRGLRRAGWYRDVYAAVGTGMSFDDRIRQGVFKALDLEIQFLEEEAKECPEKLAY